MIIKDLDLNYLEQAVELAQANYERECRHLNSLPKVDHTETLKVRLEKLFRIGNGKMAIEDHTLVGFLVFSEIFEINEQGDKGATSPLYGYGIKGEYRKAIIGKLFTEVAKSLCEHYTHSLRVNFYAHDHEVLNTYIMSGFAMDVTEVVRSATTPFTHDNNTIVSTYTFRELTKQDLQHYRTDIMAHYRHLINHLRMSPVFYHCRYFLPLEDRFDDFLKDDMRIFAAFHGEKLIGMIDSEPPSAHFVYQAEGSLCMGDVFLNPDYRGKGVASELLQYAIDCLKQNNIHHFFVMHGTINPTARGFWDKYFDNYAYTMTRQIDRSMLGIIEPI